MLILLLHSLAVVGIMLKMLVLKVIINLEINKYKYKYIYIYREKYF